jgi:hypothetical protein
MILTIRNLGVIIKSYGEIVKISVSAIQITLILYLVYKINKLKTDVLDGIVTVNSKVLNSIETVNSKVELLDLNFIKSISNIQLKGGDEVVLKMLELQNKTAASSNLPAINIVNESHAKPMVIGSLIIIVLTVCCLWWFIPKAIEATTAQFYKAEWIVSEVLRLIPGSNSAEAVTFITSCNIKIVTVITRGMPTHTIVMHDNTSIDLVDFILAYTKRVGNPALTMGDTIPAVVDIITKSGVDISAIV